MTGRYGLKRIVVSVYMRQRVTSPFAWNGKYAPNVGAKGKYTKEYRRSIMEAVATYEAVPLPDMARKPDAVLAEAKEAAQSLVSVVRQAKLSRKFGGEKEHLFYEAWQTLGKFYGLTAKVIESSYIEFGTAQGFEAKAVVITRDGMEISAAESMCLSDEPNWKNKPLFQLKSMAQTRACSKAFRNVLAWVVVLAGFSPTPAEEMTGNEYKTNGGIPPMSPPQQRQDGVITQKQAARFYALAKGNGYSDDEMKAYMKEFLGITSTKEMPVSMYEIACEWAQTPRTREPGDDEA
jgi:hypothetical protein